MSLTTTPVTMSPLPATKCLTSGAIPGLKEYISSPVFKPNVGGDRWDVKVAADMQELAFFHAASCLAALQYWQTRLPANQDVNLVLATGKTQLLALAEIERLVSAWQTLGQEDIALLNSLGVAVNRPKPFDATRIKVFHLDTILPQSRSAVYAYPHEVNRFADIFGIPENKRFLFYGDIKLPEAGEDSIYGTTLLNPKLSRMTDEMPKALEDDVGVNGLQIAAFKDGSLPPSSIQSQFLADAERYGQELAAFLLCNGGPHILNFSTGASYRGKGHIGFTEASHTVEAGENWLGMPAFLDLASFEALAGNIKADGGMHRAFTPEGKLKVGIFTLSNREIRHNPDATVILHINTSGKSSSVRAFCEEFQSNEYPVTALHDVGTIENNDRSSPAGKSTLIVEPTSFRDTLLARLPEIFCPEIAPGDADWSRFLVNLVLINNERFPAQKLFLRKLDRQAVTDAVARLVEYDERLVKQFERNLNEGWASSCFDVGFGATIVSRIEEHTVSWKTALDLLELFNGDTVMFASPHLDDVPLALGYGVDAMVSRGVRSRVVTATPGDSAVSDQYALHLLSKICELPQDVFDEAHAGGQGNSEPQNTERRLLSELTEELSKKSTRINDNPANYNFWTLMSPDEQHLRARILYFHLNNHPRWKGRFNSREKIQAIADVVSVYASESPSWSSTKPLRVLRDIKALIRYTEDCTAFMARGVHPEGFEPPIEPQWYTGGAERENTLSQDDIDSMKSRLLRERPKLIVVNGEGFMDHEAHCLTEMAMRLALKQLIESGQLDWDCRVLLYRGVWDRLEISGKENQLIVGLSREDIEDMRTSFPLHYRSQAPGTVPDGAQPGRFFSDTVIANALHTKQSLCELMSHVGETPLAAQYLRYEGVLAFDFVDLNQINRHGRGTFVTQTIKLEQELEKVRSVIQRSCHSKIVGPSPYSNLAAFRGEIGAILGRASLTEEDLFLVGESRACFSG